MVKGQFSLQYFSARQHRQCQFSLPVGKLRRQASRQMPCSSANAKPPAARCTAPAAIAQPSRQCMQAASSQMPCSSANAKPPAARCTAPAAIAQPSPPVHASSKQQAARCPALPPMQSCLPPNIRPAAQHPPCRQASRQCPALPPILFRTPALPRPVDTPGKLCRRADIKMRTRLRCLLKVVFEFQLFRDLWRGGRVDKIFPRLYFFFRWCF